jgi:hypothetical protein
MVWKAFVRKAEHIGGAVPYAFADTAAPRKKAWALEANKN